MRGFREQGLEKIVMVWLWAVFKLACDFCYSGLTDFSFVMKTSTSSNLSCLLS